MNQLSKHVHFLGALDHLSGAFMREYRNADVFVHPSVVSETNEKEAIPGAIVEAMATGLPVISTHHAGIPYVIQNGETGLLIDEWDVAALAHSIVGLAEDVNLRQRIGLRARKCAIEKLDLQQKQTELENIYDRVIEEHKARA